MSDHKLLIDVPYLVCDPIFDHKLLLDVLFLACDPLLKHI